MRKAQLIYRTAQLLFKLAEQTSQTIDLVKAIVESGALPVKYTGKLEEPTQYDDSHPIHAQIIKIFDDNNYPSNEKIAVNCTVNSNKKIKFTVSAASNKVKLEVSKLLNSLISQIEMAIQKIPPPGEDITFHLFTV